MSITQIIIFSIIIFLIISLVYLTYTQIIPFCITTYNKVYNKFFTSPFVNYNNYSILKKYNNKEIALEMLSTIDQNMIKLVYAFNAKYDNIDKMDICNKQKKLLKTIKYKLNKTYKSNSLQENFPSIVGKEVSYNVNKGEVISICLRNYNNPDEFHDLNDLIFVTIHEIAHSCNESYGHDKKFWKIFRILLEVAVENNLYKNINYQKQKKSYCSMQITYNPIFDKSLDDISYFT